MDENELNRLRALRETYDEALRICDPIDYAVRHRELLYSIAEFLIRPLQEHNLAEISKFSSYEESD